MDSIVNSILQNIRQQRCLMHPDWLHYVCSMYRNKACSNLFTSSGCMYRGNCKQCHTVKSDAKLCRYPLAQDG